MVENGVYLVREWRQVSKGRLRRDEEWNNVQGRS